jgi:hypothetical protein
MELCCEGKSIGPHVLARPEHGSKGERRGPAPGPVLPQHGAEDREGLFREPLQHVPGDEACPGDGVPLGHFVERTARGGQARTLGVRVDEVVGEEEVMDETALDDLYVEALWGEFAAAAEQEKEVGVRGRGWRGRARRRRRIGRRREAVREKVLERHGRRKAAWRWRGGGGRRRAAASEVRQWRELAMHGPWKQGRKCQIEKAASNSFLVCLGRKGNLFS